MSRWSRFAVLFACGWLPSDIVRLQADDPGGEPIGAVEFQPLAAATGRSLEALEFQGTPLPEADSAALKSVLQTGSGREGVLAIQKILDPHCLALVRINPESSVPARAGATPKQLI